MTDDMERILKIEIPPCGVGSSDGKTYDDLEGLNGWQITSGTILSWQGSIDLSGYALERKTFYPVTAFIQEAASYVAFGGSGQTIVYLVSSIPRTVNELLATIGTQSAPGFTQGSNVSPIQEDWTSLLFGLRNLNLINSTLPALGICQPIISNQFGSLSPTAADKLYVTKIVFPTTLSSSIGDSLIIPSSRIVMPGSIKEEPKLEYMMRLKRSYELANQV